MPHDADGAFMKQGSDSSPRLRLLSSRDALAWPDGFCYGG